MTGTTETEPLVVVNKWDGPTVKNHLDDTVKKILNDKIGWKEYHSLMDGRILISFIGVAFSAFGIAYDFYHPFPQSKMVLAVCSVSYFICMGVLQLYVWYVEKECFYQATESDGQQKRVWKWCSEMKQYDDKYSLSAEFVKESRSGRGKITKSIGMYIDQDGEIVVPLLQKEVDDLYNRLLRGEH
ncbi:unnamed protein product [Caenorhabditis auriculariae]|uniref:Signal peptidase complex subunit 2 n=1 Tax=Caenorhabditis auriculariae TaxID=2777116 RepID=A0A8S1GYK6_9PELO|nr:unnamed protein product [Caenorhabditis auriculariae]